MDGERLIGYTRAYTICCLLLLQFYQVPTYIPGRLDFLKSLISHARRADTTYSCCMGKLGLWRSPIRRGESTRQEKNAGRNAWSRPTWEEGKGTETLWCGSGWPGFQYHNALRVLIERKQYDTISVRIAESGLRVLIERKQYDTISVRIAESGEEVKTRNSCGK